MTTGKYTGAGEGWSDEQYADAASYLQHRADLIVSLGPSLVPGDRVVDLACGDAGLAAFLLPCGLRYLGVDATAAMVEAARRRLGDRGPVVLADLNDFQPEEPAQATTIFRAIYYARNRRGLFQSIASYTEKKLVFDLNPRQYRLEDVRSDLRAAGFDRLDRRPFFAPQTVALRGPLARAAYALERTGPLARAALRVRFTYLCAASRAT